MTVRWNRVQDGELRCGWGAVHLRCSDVSILYTMACRRRTITIRQHRQSACHDGVPSFHGHTIAYDAAENFRHGIDAPRQCQWNRVQDAIHVRLTSQQIIIENDALFNVLQSERDDGVYIAVLWPTRRHLLHLQEMACRQTHLDGG